MNLDKSDVRISVAHELGVKLDDALEAVSAEMYRQEGRTRAFKDASEAVEKLYKIVDEEINQGKFDLEQAGQVKRYIQRAIQMLTNLGVQSMNESIAYTGRRAAMFQAVSIAKKFVDEERKKVDAIRQAIAQNKITSDGEVIGDADVARIPGIRPGMSIKERRLAEMQSEVPASDAEASAPEEAPEEAEPESSTDSTPPPPSEEEEAPRKRKRR